MPDDNDLPANTSPDTITDEPVTIGEIADAVVDKLRDLLPGAKSDSIVDAGSTGTDSPPPGTAPPAVASSPVGAPTGGGPGVMQSVEDTVRRILAEKDTDSRIAAVEEKVGKPAEPKPPRSGLAAMLFGKDRA